ncbi:MAG: lycopene cyclase domain-containing protein [Ornithinimicrobium sp.]
MNHWHYLLAMGACLLITLPLELVLGARVWRRPRQMVLALLPVIVVFVIWDLWGIYRETWWYADEFITGVHLGPLPLEELVFFIVVPICGLLTYEAVGNCLTWLRGGPPPWRLAAVQRRESQDA